MRHGDLTLDPAEAEAIARTDDPELALATAPLDAWRDAHPCDCEALCTCEEER